MRIKCEHGYFNFYETAVGQVSDFMSYTGLSLVPIKDHYTFEFLLDAPNFSIEGGDYLGFLATKTYEGSFPDIFKENGIVFDFTDNTLKPILSVSRSIEIYQSGRKFITNGLILPGSLTADGNRVKDYSAWFSKSNLKFNYSEVGYV